MHRITAHTNTRAWISEFEYNDTKKKVVLEMDKKITLIYSFSILLRMKMCRYGSIPNRYPTFHKGGFLENVFNKSERGKN